jgi:putative ABC transport system permease protein
VLDLRLAASAPVVGALVGLLAALYPALRAARLETVDALRSGT